MKRQDEIRHLYEGPEPGEKPQGVGVVRFMARCPNNAEAVLNRSRQVLEVVLSQDIDNGVPNDHLIRALPQWFLEQCSKETSRQETEEQSELARITPPDEQVDENTQAKWSVSDWIYWFRPEERQWFWWDATVPDHETLFIDVEVEGWPFPWGALDWLLRASGASSVHPAAGD